MKKQMLMALVTVVVVPLSVFCQVDTTAEHFYLFTYFTGENAGTRLALSSDGIQWQKYNNAQTVITPNVGSKLMRDPMIWFDSENRIFHLVWTTGWNDKTIGYSSSTNLKAWDTQTAIPVGQKIQNCGNCWAPEIFYDDLKDSFMVFWSTETSPTIGKRPYYVMTKNFESFSDPVMFFDPGYTAIDWCMLKAAENTYYMFFKDERNGKKYIQFVYATTPQGPWSAPSPAITTTGCEGPTAIKIGNEYRVYFDPFTNDGSTYRMVRVTNLDTTASPWPSGGTLKSGSSNFTYRHGHIIEIPREYVMFLLYDQPLPTTQTAGLQPSRVRTPRSASAWATVDLLGRTVSTKACAGTPPGLFLHPRTAATMQRKMTLKRQTD